MSKRSEDRPLEGELERFEHGRRTVVLCQDTVSDFNPRKEYADSNLATLTCCHRRYNLGDEMHSEPMSPKDIVRKARDAGDNAGVVA